MRGRFLGLMVALMLLLPIEVALSAGKGGGVSAPGQKKVKTVTVSGKLTAYGAKFVEVKGRRIPLCKDAEILDTNEHLISTSGLCGTENVQVKMQGSCALKVQVLLLRR